MSDIAFTSARGRSCAENSGALPTIGFVTEPSQAAAAGATVIERPYAFFSYSHDDWDCAVRLVEELKLRGFTVFRDVERMREGKRLDDEMAEGLDSADLLMCLLTEHSLESEPVVEREFKPALRKTVREGRPTVMPVACGLGATHEEVTERTWKTLQHDFSATWSGGIMAGPAADVTQADAAAIAGKAVNAVYPPGLGPAAGVWQLQVVSRGAPAACDGLSVDASSFLGGARPQIGHPAAWQRVLDGLADLERALRGHGGRREVEVSGAAHLTAAVATGFTFRRPAGWRLTVGADDGACHAQNASQANDALGILSEPGSAGSAFVTAEINLLGREMDGVVDNVRAGLGRPSLRLRVEHINGSAPIPCTELASMASATARAIKQAVGERRADAVHLFLAAPFAFGVFLGAELNAVGAFVQLYEWADHHYHQSLEIESR